AALKVPAKGLIVYVSGLIPLSVWDRVIEPSLAPKQLTSKWVSVNTGATAAGTSTTKTRLHSGVVVSLSKIVTVYVSGTLTNTVNGFVGNAILDTTIPRPLVIS